METLIVFANKEQRSQFHKAFPEISGAFKLYGDSLTGSRYARVIAFRPDEGGSAVEFSHKIRELEEHIPCRVVPGGTFTII